MEGLYVFKNNTVSDNRGDFTKVFNCEVKEKIGFTPIFKEAFFSNSVSGAIRGMHLQIGQFENFRLIYMSVGKARDVLIDLRRDSSTYAQVLDFELTAKSGNCLFVPPGVAHGFQAIENCTINYLATTDYSLEHDAGVNPLSFNYPWPLQVTSISERDRNLPTMQEWASK